MLTLHKRFGLAAAFSAALMMSAPALAQGWRDARGWASSEGQYQAYDHGYRKGIDQGRDDAKHHRPADYRRDKDYRKADDGYKGRYGPREWYENEFRRGYVAGYTRGYDEYGRRYDNRGYRNDGYRNDGYYGNDRDDRRGGYYGDGAYRDGRAVPRGDVYGRNGAFNRGYSDGLEKGRSDLRRNRSFDPTRHGWYRSANRGYEREYGARDSYEASYRQGFMRGYSEAYRGGR